MAAALRWSPGTRREPPRGKERLRRVRGCPAAGGAPRPHARHAAVPRPFLAALLRRAGGPGAGLLNAARSICCVT